MMSEHSEFIEVTDLQPKPEFAAYWRADSQGLSARLFRSRSSTKEVDEHGDWNLERTVEQMRHVSRHELMSRILSRFCEQRGVMCFFPFSRAVGRGGVVRGRRLVFLRPFTVDSLNILCLLPSEGVPFRLCASLFVYSFEGQKEAVYHLLKVS